MELVWYKQQRDELGRKRFSGTHGTAKELTVSQKERESRGEGVVWERGRDAAEGPSYVLLFHVAVSSAPGQCRVQDTDLTWKPLIITLLFSLSLGTDFVTSGIDMNTCIDMKPKSSNSECWGEQILRGSWHRISTDVLMQLLRSTRTAKQQHVEAMERHWWIQAMAAFEDGRTRGDISLAFFEIHLCGKQKAEANIANYIKMRN